MVGWFSVILFIIQLISNVARHIGFLKEKSLEPITQLYIAADNGVIEISL